MVVELTGALLLLTILLPLRCGQAWSCMSTAEHPPHCCCGGLTGCGKVICQPAVKHITMLMPQTYLPLLLLCLPPHTPTLAACSCGQTWSSMCTTQCPAHSDPCCCLCSPPPELQPSGLNVLCSRASGLFGRGPTYPYPRCVTTPCL
jgi:hypothetical protein